MKVKLSKKILSVILAALMVVTSIPVIGFVAFANESNAIDPDVVEVETAMDAFETKLSSQGMYTNVTAAYNAYVDCQEALDAYIYGGEADALEGKADALTNAMNNIGTFEAKKGTAVPTFDGSSGNMADYAGVVYNNVLYSEQTTESNAKTGTTPNVNHSIYFSPVTVVLYDGTSAPRIPVMHKGIITAAKARWIYASYPSAGNGNNAANPDFSMIGYWADRSGGTLDFTWTWWNASANNGPGYSPTVLGDANHRSSKLDYNTTWYGGFDSGVPKYIANAMEFTGAPTATGTEYSTYWYVTSGSDPNSDTGYVDTTANKIYVVNYKALTDAIQANGNKMKSVDLALFSEGGLNEYITAMDAAANFDPNSYFTSDNGYTNCVNALDSTINSINNAAIDKTDSSDYQALRDAMSQSVRTMYSLGNTGYTEATWKAFAQAYESAQAVMAGVNDGGYVSGSIASNAAKTLNEKVAALEVDGAPVDASSLITAIDTFASYDKSYFTTESYTPALEVVNQAKIALWGSEEHYGIATYLPDDSSETQALVSERTQAVLDATKTLRISNAAVVAVENTQRYSLVTAYALRDSISNPGDYTNINELDSAISKAQAYEATLASKELTDFNAQIAEYTTYVNAIVVAYENLHLSFTALADGTIVDTTYGSTAGYSSDDNTLYMNNAVIQRIYIKTKTGTSSYTTPYDLTYDNAWYQWPNYKGIQLHSLGFGAYGEDTMTTSDGSMKVTWKEGGAVIASSTGAYSDYHSYLMKLPENVVDGSDYINIPENSKGNKIFGETTVTVGDVGIKAVSFTTPDLYFYYVCNGEPRDRSGDNANKDVKQTVTVVDISKLFDLVKQAGQLMVQYDHNNYKCYTDYTWNNFMTMYKNAQADMDYHNMTAQQIVTEANTRYNNLNSSIKALTKNATGTHKFVELDGSQHATCTQDGTLYLQCSLCGYETTVTETATDHDYVYTPNNDGKTHKVTCSRDDLEETLAPCTNNGNNVCKDCGQTLLASWDEYVAAINSLKSDLNTKLYPVSKLNEINSALAELTYYDAYINSNTDSIFADEQDAINTEAQTITSLIPTKGAIDISALEAAKEVVKDPDQYDADSIANLEAELYGEVEIAGTKIKGTIYEDQDAVNAAVNEALNSVMTYSITFNSMEIATDLPYGTKITIDGEGNIITDDEIPAEGVYAWSGHYAAPSLGTDTDGSYNESNDKYLVSSNTYTFVLKGDTYLTAINGEDDTSTSYKITIKSDVPIYTTSRVSIIDVLYTAEDGSFTLPEAPSYAFYKFVGYKTVDGEDFVATQVSEDTVVIAQYEVVTQNWYITSQYDTIDSYFWQEPTLQSEENYNVLINYLTTSISEDDFFCWANVTDVNIEGTDYHLFDVVSYEYDYSFYVCEDVNLVPLTLENVQYFYESQNGAYFPTQTDYIYCLLRCDDQVVDPANPGVNVIANDELFAINDANGDYEKFSMIGSYAVPEGYKVIEKGFLINGDPDSEVAAEDFVVTNEALKRVKVIHLTCGNQFVLNVKGIAKDSPIDYCAYAIVEDSEGNRYEVYSNAVMNATAE